MAETPSLAPPDSDPAGRARREVIAGLRRSQPEISSKLFYDRRGSELFEQITTLPEYYLTRTERALLAEHIRSWLADFRPHSLLELGAGSAEKTRTILDAMGEAGTLKAYAPVDISADFLADTADRLRQAYPALRIYPVVADLAAGVSVPQALPRPTLFAFLGSTLGNFVESAAITLLRGVRTTMGAGDRLLLGADLVKAPHLLEAAYNDAAGVTAAFNRNALRVLNRDYGADFELDSWEHQAPYLAAPARIEMHLVASRRQTVHLPGAPPLVFATGESIRTEVCGKYTRPSLESLLGAAGLHIQRWAEAAPGYAVLLAGLDPAAAA